MNAWCSFVFRVTENIASDPQGEASAMLALVAARTEGMAWPTPCSFGPNPFTCRRRPHLVQGDRTLHPIDVGSPQTPTYAPYPYLLCSVRTDI